MQINKQQFRELAIHRETIIQHLNLMSGILRDIQKNQPKEVDIIKYQDCKKCDTMYVSEHKCR